MKDDELSMWTIYDHPKDYPTYFVARRWRIARDRSEPIPTDDVLFSLTYEFIELVMRQRGLTKIERCPSDDPVIKEVWL